MATTCNEDQFQGVVCCFIGETDQTSYGSEGNSSQIQDTIVRLLDLKTSSIYHDDITCHNLHLKNKYYQATIHLFDYDLLTENRRNTDFLETCQAIILHGNGQRLTTEQLNQKADKLSSVGGEPRVLLCKGIDEECEPYKALLGWCVKNGYDLILTEEEDAKTQLIDSLSAYRWTKRTSATSPQPQAPAPSQSDGNNVHSDDRPKLDDEMMKKLMDFDSLLGKLSAYRERPELRGDPDDKNIEEIAQILSGLLGDDVDSFLGNDEVSATDGAGGAKGHEQF